MMNTLVVSRTLLVAIIAALWGTSNVQAQTTYIWANSNVSDVSVTNDWFSGGSNPQGTWTGGDPVSSSLNTIQFFQDIATAVTNTVNTTKGANLNNSGSAFQLGTLTLNGKAPATSGASLTMNILGDALNFSGATGTVNFSSASVTAYNRHVNYNLNNAILLGTASSSSTLAIAGNGGGSYSIKGSVAEVQSGGGSKLVKSGSCTATISSNVTLTGGIEVNAGTLNLSGSGNAITGGIVLNGSTLGGGLSTSTLGNNPITVNNSANMQFASGAINAGVITINSGMLSLVNSTVNITGPVTGSGGLAIANSSGGTVTVDLNSTSNSFTGPVTMSSLQNATLNVKSLGDAVGAGNIRFGSDTRVFTFNFKGDAPLTLNYRQFDIVANATIRNISTNSQAFTINTDMIVTNTATARTIKFGGTGAGLSTFAGAIGNGSSVSVSVEKIDTNTWVFSGTNTYSGITTVSGGKLVLVGGKCLSDTNALYIASGKTVQLETGVKEKIGKLFLDNVQQADGSWGAVGNTKATYNSAYLLGSGLLFVNVDPPPTGSLIYLK